MADQDQNQNLYQFDRSKLPITSIMNYLWGYETPENRTGPEYTPQTPGAPTQRRIPSLLEDIISRGELEGAEFFANPGAGKLGATRVSPSSGMSGRQLRWLNQLGDWLNRAGVEHSVARPRGDTAYMYARHPYTGERIAIRVPQDTHMGRVDTNPVAHYRDINRPGNFFDTGGTLRRTGDPIQPEFAGNVSGEPFYNNMPALLDALRHRLSTDPHGQFLVPPGREPHYPAQRITPIPLTEIPINWGRRGIRSTPPESVMNSLNGPRRITLPPRQLEFLFR